MIKLLPGPCWIELPRSRTGVEQSMQCPCKILPGWQWALLRYSFLEFHEVHAQDRFWSRSTPFAGIRKRVQRSRLFAEFGASAMALAVRFSSLWSRQSSNGRAKDTSRLRGHFFLTVSGGIKVRIWGCFPLTYHKE